LFPSMDTHSTNSPSRPKPKCDNPKNMKIHFGRRPVSTYLVSLPTIN
jgi:hypothetical protein